MATIANPRPGIVRDVRFFLISAIVMAAALVFGFSMQLAMGRSSFGAPIYVHLHAIVFFGWVVLYLLQNILAGNASAVAIHKRLGWLAVVWVPMMVVMGLVVTFAIVRRAGVPFFFTPLYFLIMDPLSLFTFAGLTTAAIVKRRDTQWHRRLMFCGMAILTGPGFGRFLPMPFVIPWAGWVVFIPIILFPIAGVIRDLRVSGKVHPGWWWGIGTMLAMQFAISGIAASPLGLAIYDAVTAGSPGAAIAPREYPPFPL